MMSSNEAATPHNPHRIEENVTAPRKGRAGRFHRMQVAGLSRQQPLAVQRRTHPPMGRVLAEFGMLVLWFALWLLNGLATALGVAAVGSLLSSRGLATGLDRVDWLVIGGVFHLFISAVEGHLWRSDYARPEGIAERVSLFFARADRMRLVAAVVVGAIDSLSTAWYIRRVLDAFNTPAIGGMIVSALLATTIALSAEPLIRNFASTLRDLFMEG